jgi:hypothetical protein
LICFLAARAFAWSGVCLPKERNRNFPNFFFSNYLKIDCTSRFTNNEKRSLLTITVMDHNGSRLLSSNPFMTDGHGPTKMDIPRCHCKLCWVGIPQDTRVICNGRDSQKQLNGYCPKSRPLFPGECSMPDVDSILLMSAGMPMDPKEHSGTKDKRI